LDSDYQKHSITILKIIILTFIGDGFEFVDGPNNMLGFWWDKEGFWSPELNILFKKMYLEEHKKNIIEF